LFGDQPINLLEFFKTYFLIFRLKLLQTLSLQIEPSLHKRLISGIAKVCSHMLLAYFQICLTSQTGCMPHKPDWLYASQARLVVCLTSQTYVTDIETCQPRSTRLDLQRVLVMCVAKLLPYKPNWTLLLLLVKGAPLKNKTGLTWGIVPTSGRGTAVGRMSQALS